MFGVPVARTFRIVSHSETSNVPTGRALDARGLEILSEVAQFLAAGLGSEEVLSRVAGALARGLETSVVRIWVRSTDGASFRAIVGEGFQQPQTRPSGEIRVALGDRIEERRGTEWLLRYPLSHEGEELGLLEAVVADGPSTPSLARVAQIVANVLSPLLAALELSEDLASEVALRTREIEAQRRFTAKIIDSLPVGLYVIDTDYRIQAWNRKRETGTQGVVREEAIGRTVFEVLHRQPHKLLKREFDRVFRTGELEAMEVASDLMGDRRHYRLTKIPMRVEGDDVTHVITIGEDITEWKNVQQQVAQTEKLAAVGQLAAGVMHEINNPLATIRACVDWLAVNAEDMPDGVRGGIEEYLGIIESELNRCSSIVNGLLDFSRPKARMKKAAHLNQILEEALFLVKHHDRFKGITLEYTAGDDLPTINANREQLIQVFLALMLNAIDAMEGKGALTVRTERNPDRHDEVVVLLSDTGVGIAHEELSKIFEPFYTTKQPGRGTGLGLSICYGIVQEHGGRISVESQIGAGSEFRVYLPALVN